MRYHKSVIVLLLVLGLGIPNVACGEAERLQGQDALVRHSAFWTSAVFGEVNDVYRMVTSGSDPTEIEKEYEFGDESVLADLQARKASGDLAGYVVTGVAFPEPGQLIDGGSPLEATAWVFEYPAASGESRIYEYHLDLVETEDGRRLFQFSSYQETP